MTSIRIALREINPEQFKQQARGGELCPKILVRVELGGVLQQLADLLSQSVGHWSFFLLRLGEQ